MNGERIKRQNKNEYRSKMAKTNPRLCRDLGSEMFQKSAGSFFLDVLIVVGMFCSGESPASRATLVYNRGFWCGPGWFLLPSNSAPAHTWRTPYNLIELLFGDTFWWCRCGCLSTPPSFINLCRHLNNRCEVVFNPSKSKRNKKKVKKPSPGGGGGSGVDDGIRPGDGLRH